MSDLARHAHIYAGMQRGTDGEIVVLMSLTSLLPPGLSLLQGIELFIQVIGDTTAVNRAAGMNYEMLIVYGYPGSQILLTAAASAWVAYDICLTFAEEVWAWHVRFECSS